LSKATSSPAKRTAVFAIVAALVVGFIVLITWFTRSFDKTDGGHVAVVRNGGPFDSNSIRQVLPPNSGLTNIGYASSMHRYPTSQRFFTIDSSGKGDSDEVVQVPTADGVEVGIEGQVLFTMNTSPDHNYGVLRKFDNSFGTRTFKCANSSDREHVYDGDSGFSCFLEQIVGQIIKNDLRAAVGDLRCADLVASCSLVQNSSAQIDPSKIGKGNVNLANIESAISTSLQTDLDESMHGNYLNVDRFNLAKVDLPKPVQDAITRAQSQFANVSQAQAAQKKALIEANTRLQQAKIDAAANAERQKGYNNCSTCAQIDIVKALPKGITVYAPGNGNIAVPAK
jgi:regulator of protease activity HflC (stomatin/prohibitin superfamily)